MSLEQPPSRFILTPEEHDEIEAAISEGVGLSMLTLVYGAQKIEAFWSRPRSVEQTDPTPSLTTEAGNAA